MAYKGKFTPEHKEKYHGDASKITYRSMWERSMMKYLDNTQNVILWGSEEVVIPYISPIDGKRHRYFIDFHAKIRQKDGTIKSFLVEVKPFAQTRQPKEPKTKTAKAQRRYQKESRTYITNLAKWRAATRACESSDWEFIIITEKELYGK